MTTRRTIRTNAARVAAVASIVVLASYVIGVIVLNAVVVHRLTHTVDGRLTTVLHDVKPADLRTHTSGPNGSGKPEHGADVDDAPTFLWTVSSSGRVTALDTQSPRLPRRAWSAAPITVSIGSTPFRFGAQRLGQGWLVGGQSVAQISRVENAAREPEILIGLALLIVVFAGSMIIGLRAAAPLELVRRRQAEFTADASHEMRTPVSVIEAEVDLALSRRRDAAAYEATLQRVGSEGKRLGRIVDDLLFLARTDAAKGTDDSRGPCDVASVSAACTERFGTLAERSGIAISFQRDGRGPFDVLARAEDIDRLVGVLVDNACKHAGSGGRVAVSVRASGGRVSVEVADTGTGIPAGEVPHIFDRFHRVTDGSVGTGLGLAIADAVVQATRGAWTVGRSPLGGAHMEVSWRRATRHPTTTPGKRRPDLGGGTDESLESPEASGDTSTEQGAATPA